MTDVEVGGAGIGIFSLAAPRANTSLTVVKSSIGETISEGVPDNVDE